MQQSVWNFYVLQPGDSVSEVFRRLYGMPPSEFVRYQSMIAANNPHISNLNHVRPGQLIDLRLQCAVRPMNHAADMIRAEAEYRSMSDAERQAVQEIPHFLNTIAGWFGATSLNTVDAGFMTVENLIRSYATEVERYGVALRNAYATGSRGTLETEFTNKVLNRRPVLDAFSRLPEYLRRKVIENGTKLTTPFNFREASLIKETRNILRLAPYSLSSYNPFSSALRDYSQVLRRAKIGGMATTWVIPTAIGIHDSVLAYGTPEFGRTVAGASGNVVGGALGTLGGYAACNLIFAAPSAGTSLFWCGIAAGAGGGMAGGMLGTWFGESVYTGVGELQQVSTRIQNEVFMQMQPFMSPLR